MWRRRSSIEDDPKNHRASDTTKEHGDQKIAPTIAALAASEGPKGGADKPADKWQIAYTVFTFIIMIGTVVQAYLAHQALVSVQRAYISVDKLKVTPNIIGDQLVAWTVNPVVVNSGPTPAVNFYWRVAIGNPNGPTPPGVQRPRDPPDFPPISEFLNHHKMETAVIGPQSTTDDLLTLNGFGAQDLVGNDDQVDTGEFIWGALVYGDVFNPNAQHITEFCYQMIRTTLVQNQTAPYERCAHYNCSDSGCNTQPNQ